MKKLILTLLVVLTTTVAWAVRAFPGIINVTQKDGTQLTITQYGDANFHYNITTDGVLLYQEGRDYYIAHINSNGELENTGVLAHNAGERTNEEQTLIKQQDRKKFFTEADKVVLKTRKREPIATNSTLFPHIGSPKALIILADFTDQPFKHDDATTLEIFDQYLNSESGKPTHEADATLSKNYGSVKKYFTDMSFGKFTPVFDVKAVVHLSNDMAYYGPGKNDRMDLFVKEACQLAHDQGVNFAEYDANEDSYVDLVYIIYAGYGQSYSGNDANTIWPKSGTGNYGSFDGKTVCRYGVHNEINYNPEITKENFNEIPQINGIGLFCHEFSHCMGLPDFYPTNASAQNAGNASMEYWSVMDGGEYTNSGYYPTAYTAWERESMGWMEIETLTDDMKGNITLENIDKDGKAYRIYPDEKTNGNEYLILQNIQPYGWNLALGNIWGHGMLITHVDYDAIAFSLNSNTVNNTIGHSRMTVIPACGEYISYYKQGEGKTYTSDEYKANHRAHPYPGTKNVTEIENFTMYDGTMNKPFYNIQETDGVITFDFLEATTAIKAIETADIQNTNERIYTLDGRLVNTTKDRLPKGIYIIGNKKTIVR